MALDETTYGCCCHLLVSDSELDQPPRLLVAINGSFGNRNQSAYTKYTAILQRLLIAHVLLHLRDKADSTSARKESAQASACASWYSSGAGNNSTRFNLPFCRFAPFPRPLPFPLPRAVLRVLSAHVGVMLVHFRHSSPSHKLRQICTGQPMWVSRYVKKRLRYQLPKISLQTHPHVCITSFFQDLLSLPFCLKGLEALTLFQHITQHNRCLVLLHSLGSNIYISNVSDIRTRHK